MPVTHVNRSNDTYFLHSGTTKTGKPRYWFSMKADGDLVDSIPEGFEVYENPGNQVFLRKIQPQVILPLEVATVEAGLKRYAPEQNCLVDVQKADLVIYHADRVKYDLEDMGVFRFRELPVRFHRYEKVIRFTLVDPKTRTFRVQRWCFRGSIDRWIDLYKAGGRGTLADLVKEFAPHIGQESFFDLM
jgi:hypothetical protein